MGRAGDGNASRSLLGVELRRLVREKKVRRLQERLLAPLFWVLLAVWLIPPVGSRADEGLEKALATGPPSAEMRSINQLFTQNYARALEHSVDRVKQTGLIVVQGGDLFLYLDGDQVDHVKTGAPPTYQNLKIIDHLPLAAYVLLIDDADKGPMGSETRVPVRQYLDVLRSLQDSIDEGRFPNRASLPRQRQILEDTTEFLAGVLAQGRVSEASLLSFARSQAASLNANLSGAAGAQLTALNRVIVQWRREYIDVARWPSMRVVVMGAATAHHRELHLQYFSEVMGVPLEGTDRLMFYEGEDRAGAESLAGRYALDGGASVAFFDRRNRLFSDLMAQATQAWLVEHAGELDPAFRAHD